MLRLLKTICFVLIIAGSTQAQDLNQYEKRWLIEGADTLPYRILLPNNYDASKKYPLILFLHGAGERGRNNESQLIHGSKFFLKAELREQFLAIVVFPQCPAGSSWTGSSAKYDSAAKMRVFSFPQGGEPTRPMAMVMKLLSQLQKDFRINSKRMYVGGLSMGGMGTFDLVSRMPKTFAAAFPICGGDNPADAPAMRKTAWWVFHGDKDLTVPLNCSSTMVDALKQFKKTEVKFTVYPGVGHNSWDNAFAEPELLPWLFSYKK
jgi:predicted peptidase